jgi:hypothetical protein
MWSNLPSNLRTVLGAALVLGIGVAVAAFTLSFFALRSAAENPALKFGAGHAWLFPIGIDMALVFFEVLLVGASMVRVEEHGKIVSYPRTIPFLLVIGAGVATLYFNATRVPDRDGLRLIALSVPVASLLVTLGLAYLLKMLAAISGATIAHIAPPSDGPSRLTRRQDTIEGHLERLPSTTTIQGPQNGQAKRRAVEAYLATLDDDELANLTDSQLAEDMGGLGVPVSRTYAGSILGQWRTGQPAISSRRRNSRSRTRKR